MTEVASLLQRSRAAHLAKKHAVRVPPDYPKAEAHIREAIQCREQAEALDPTHSDPCWSEDQALNQGVASVELLAWFTVNNRRSLAHTSRRVVGAGSRYVMTRHESRSDQG